MSALVLASSSAARARVLAAAGLAIETDPAAIDEDRIKAEGRAACRGVRDCAERLAEAKARAVAARHRGALVLGVDQMLECDGSWFDKPANLAQARAQLQALNGRCHELVTAAAIVRDHAVLWRALERPRLTMRRFSDEFLERYLTTMGQRVLATVGGYELEGLGAQLMTRIEGDYFAILGLPLLPLLDFLRGAGVLES